MSHGGPDREAAEIARKQHGLLRVGDATAAGLTDRMIRTRVVNGLLQRVGPGVLRVAGAPVTWHQELLAAVFSGGSAAVASHRAAAMLHHLDTFGRRVIRMVEISVPRSRHLSRIPGVVHTSTDLIASDVTIVGGIPCTAVARTLADLGAVIPVPQLEHCTDGALRDGKATYGELAAILRRVRRRGRPGITALESVLLARGLSIPESVLERLFLRTLRRAGIPEPALQHHVRRPDGRDAFVDFAYVDVMLAIEVDGHGSHATRAQRAADAERANQLALAGWTVLRFTYEDVRQRPQTVAATVRRARAGSRDAA